MRFFARWILVLAVVCTDFAYTNQANAQSASETFVTRRIRGRDVLRVTGTLELPASRAFGIARVTIGNPKRRSPRDRNLIVVYYNGSWGSGMEGFSYAVPAVLHEGQSQVTVEIPHVQSGQQNSWDIAVYEDGVELEDKRQQPPNTMTFQWANEANPSAVAAIQGTGADAKQINDNMKKLIESNSVQVTRQATVVLAPGVRNPQLAGNSGHIVPIKELSTDWRYYYPYAVWTVDSDTLSELNESFPEQALALRTYVAAGGVIFVQHANEGTIGELDVLLGLNQDDSVYASRAWRTSDTDVVVPSQQLTTSDAIARNHQEVHAALLKRGILETEYLGGHVVVSDTQLSDLNDAGKPFTRSFKNHVIATTTLGMDGNWFWRNLITAVGKPPVWTFAAIVTLFGSLLGPGLLFLTGRIGRRSLMILLVPVISIIATGAIITYGVLHEGFETHIRVISVTELDAATKKGFCWSRQNIFSGLPPREGLRFKRDTYARPVYAFPENRYRYSDPRDSVDCRVTLTGINSGRVGLSQGSNSNCWSDTSLHRKECQFS